MYHGRQASDAGRALLEVALKQAGKGSWERIGVGHAYYLGGFKPEGQAIFDACSTASTRTATCTASPAGLPGSGRMGPGETAVRTLPRSNPNDENALAEIGASYLPHGDRARTEQLFDHPFPVSPDELRATLAAADACLNMRPEG